MEIEFYVDNEDVKSLHADEICERLLKKFPGMEIDRAKGDSYVQTRLEELISMGAPDVIIQDHHLYFGNVVYVAIAEQKWAGMAVTSYIHSIRPPLGDMVSFDFSGPLNSFTVDIAITELASALQMSQYVP